MREATTSSTGSNARAFSRNGPAKLDIVKLQHHGSARNTDERFFSTVLADHYVISANGEYRRNPDLATFDALVAARGPTGYRVWMTNGGPETALAPLVEGVRATYPKLDLRVRPRTRRSLLLNLGDEPA